MRCLIPITILFTVHLASATIDIQQLHENAAIKIQKLKDQATTGLQQLKDSIDMDKLKQLDFLNIIPRVQIQDRLHHQNGPSHLERIKFYLQSIKGLTGKDLVIAFDAGIPWPAVKRMDDDIEYALE